MVVADAINNLTVSFASGGNVLGMGILKCTGVSTLRWKDFGGTYGPEETIGNGETKVIESGTSPFAYLRVTRTSAEDLEEGEETLTLSSPLNNLFGMDNVSIALALAGGNQYRGSILKNVSSGQVQSVKKWISQLGTARISEINQLSGSGAGVVSGKGSLSDWPTSGYCRIETSAGVLRELIYYTNRSNTTLTVPAEGRGLLGTAATAGVDTDIMRSVPGVAIAIDTAGVTAPGSIQTIASESIAPAAVTWNLEIGPAGGLNIGNMNTLQQVGIWYWRQIPAGAVALPRVTNKFGISFDAF